MPPIVSAGPERRSRDERRAAHDRIARIEEILSKQGPLPSDEIAAVSSTAKRTAASRGARRKKASQK